MDNSTIMVAVAVVTCVCSLGGWIFKLSGRLSQADAKADAAAKDATAAGINAAALRVRLEQTERDLNDHRVYVAREYASNQTLVALETKLISAIDRLGDRLDKVFTGHAV